MESPLESWTEPARVNPTESFGCGYFIPNTSPPTFEFEFRMKKVQRSCHDRSSSPDVRAQPFLDMSAFMATRRVFSELPLRCDPKRRAMEICEQSILDSGEWDTRDTWQAPVGLKMPAIIIALRSAAYLNPLPFPRGFTPPKGWHLSSI